MSDNVISLGTRKTLDEDRAELRQAEEVHQQHLDAAAELHKKNLLKMLDDTKARVETGDIDGLCMAGRNPHNGAFLSTALLNASSTRVDTYLAYSGILGAMQFDMIDLANSGPHMNPDGSYFALGGVQEIVIGEDDD